MYFESLRAENIRHLGSYEHDFGDGLGAIRKWTVLEATEASGALLRCLALAGLGRRQIPRVAPRICRMLIGQGDRPSHLEFVLIRHAPQERGLHSPVRRQSGWQLRSDGRFMPLPKPAFRLPGSGAQPGLPELGRSHCGRLVAGHGEQVKPHDGTDQFDIYPDQRGRRCATLFDAEARVTDALAFLLRLRHKSLYRKGRARALLARLGEAWSAWLGWDVADYLDRPGDLAMRWHATPAARRMPAVVLVDIARHAYDASECSADPDPLMQPGVVLLAGVESWGAGIRLKGFLELLDARFPNLQFIVTLAARSRRHFPPQLFQRRLPVPVKFLILTCPPESGPPGFVAESTWGKEQNGCPHESAWSDRRHRNERARQDQLPCRGLRPSGCRPTLRDEKREIELRAGAVAGGRTRGCERFSRLAPSPERNAGRPSAGQLDVHGEPAPTRTGDHIHLAVHPQNSGLWESLPFVSQRVIVGPGCRRHQQPGRRRPAASWARCPPPPPRWRASGRTQ